MLVCARLHNTLYFSNFADNFSDPVISRKQFTFSAGYIFNATSCATDPTAFGQTVQFSSKAGQSITTQDLNTDYAGTVFI